MKIVSTEILTQELKICRNNFLVLLIEIKFLKILVFIHGFYFQTEFRQNMSSILEKPGVY
jgi:hypothetical protein